MPVGRFRREENPTRMVRNQTATAPTAQTMTFPAELRGPRMGALTTDPSLWARCRPPQVDFRPALHQESASRGTPLAHSLQLPRRAAHPGAARAAARPGTGRPGTDGPG